MTTTSCTKCGSTFYRSADEQWKRLCLSCWKRSKNTEGAFLSRDETVARLEVEIGLLKLKLAERQTETAIPPDMLPRLIRLCHPDRHGNAESANIATAWLLSQRRS